MATQVQFRRGTTGETSSFTGAFGEVTVDTTKNICVVHNGSTPGGFPLMREDGTNMALSLGTLSSCALKFTADPDTGLISPGPNQISFVTGGVSRLAIDSAGAASFSSNVTVGGSLAVTGAFTFGLGSAAAPPITFTGDTDTGIYSPGANQVGITTNGVGRLFVDGSGNITLSSSSSLVFEGSTNDGFETTLAVADPTADQVLTLPNVTGTLITTGDTGTVTSTMIANSTIVDADISASAAIVDTKLATISTAGKVSNSATTATSSNTASAIVARDASGNFSAGTITATFSGSGASLTSLPAGQLTGTIPSAVLGNSSLFIGTTSVALNRASGDLGLAGISSLAMPGASSGTITLTPAATAGTTAITIPATSGTLITTGDTGTVTSTMIANGTIVDADINASAAIAGSKINPDFGSQTISTTGVFSAALGSAAAPSITFTGDTNTGIYSPGADQVAISTNGTGQLFVDSNGRTGVGTATPDAKLHCVGQSTFTGSLLVNAAARASTGSSAFIRANNGFSSATTPDYSFWFDDDCGMFHPTGDTLALTTNGSERLRITSAGLVGVGTSSPGQLLEIASASNPQMRFTDTGDYYYDIGITSSNKFSISPAGSPALTVVAAGNVGIGTTSPAKRLESVETSSTGTGALRLRNDQASPLLDIGVWGSAASTYGGITANSAFLQATNANLALQTEGGAFPIIFAPNASERARIDSSGRLLVGTSSARGNYADNPQFQLEGTDNNSSSAQVLRNSNNAGGATFYLGKTRGASIGGTTVVASGDDIGNIRWVASDGTSLLGAASITASVDGTPGANDMPGRLVFSTTADGASSPTERMRISNAGTTTLTSAASTAPFIANIGASEVARIDSSGRLLVGTSSAIAATTLTPGFQHQGTDGAFANAGFGRWTNDNGGYALYFAKSRGTSVGTQSIVNDGDFFGAIFFEGSDGTQLRRAASITANVDGTPGAGDMPGRLVFFTTADGASSPTERMRIDNAGNIGLGSGSITANRALQISRNYTGATSGAVITIGGTIQSDTTGTFTGISSFPSTQDTAFTLNVLQHFLASEGTITGGSRTGVTNQFGFIAASNLTGATNNYGFYSNIFSGTGRWNFYCNGTADSYFASNNFIWANGGGERARIDSSGRLLVGTSSARANFYNGANTAQIQLEGTNFQNAAFAIVCNANSDDKGSLILAKNRGTTVGSNTIVQDGDDLGSIEFQGSDGSEFVQAANIKAEVDGTPGLNDMPGRIVLSTTLDGASSPTERLRITNDGVMCYNQPAPTSKSAAATLTVAELKTGIIQYTGAAATLTLPTGTLTEGGFAGIYTNMTFEWSVINTGSGTCTIGAGASHTITGGATIAAGASGRFATRRTAANTFVSYRLS